MPRHLSENPKLFIPSLEFTSTNVSGGLDEVYLSSQPLDKSLLHHIKSMLKCKHAILAISVLNNIFPLYTKMQNYPLKYHIVLY